MKQFFRENRTGLLLAIIHFVAFLATVAYVTTSAVEQTPFIWLIWLPIDLPWSLLHLAVGAEYANWTKSIYEWSPVLGHILHAPYIIHGFIGMIWWFFLPKIFSRFNKKRMR